MKTKSNAQFEIRRDFICEHNDQKSSVTILLEINYKNKTFSITPARKNLSDKSFRFIDSSLCGSKWKAIAEAIIEATETAQEELAKFISQSNEDAK